MLLSPAAALVLRLLLICSTLGHAAKLLGEVRKVEALLDGRATMPCDVVPSSKNDSLLMLVWYRDNKPIYSFDGRLQKHWRSKDFPASDRLLFTFHTEPPALLLDHVRMTDQAVYRCRADFELSPTRNSGVNLVVIILPSSPFFMDEIGTKVEHTVGPFHEGDNLLLVCMAVGGKPPPKLSWWKWNTLLDSSDEESEVPGVRENQLLVRLTRDYARARLQCLAANNNITAPLVSTLTIDLYVSPETVAILSSKQALSVGKVYELPCYVNGSHPLPEISWWLDGKLITDQIIVTENMKNEVISNLHFKPRIEHNGRDLTCLATNAALAPSHATKLHTIRLNIFFPPVLSLSLVTSHPGSGLAHEGQVLQLRCMAEANPWITNTEWFANNRTIQGGSLNGSEINLSSSDLLILKASSEHSGNYTCMAFNLEGSGISNNLKIVVLYKPRCLQNETSIDRRAVHLSCPLDSLPVPSKFFWRIENQNDTKFNENILITETKSIDLTAIQKRMDKSDMEDVTVSCWAANEVGEQRQPCFLYLGNILKAPDPPENCKIDSKSDSLIVNCSPISDTDSTDSRLFGVSVWQRLNGSRVLLGNVSSPLTGARVGGLHPGQPYELLLYSYNRWGESEPVRILADTFDSSLILDNRQADIGLWSGIAVAIFVIFTLLVIVCIIKKKSKTITNDAQMEKNEGTNRTSDKLNYSITSNADITEKPLLYKNGKNNVQNKIVTTKNNPQPKNNENINLVQNKDGEQLVPPSISRSNKPRLPIPNVRSNNERKAALKAKRSLGHGKRDEARKASMQMEVQGAVDLIGLEGLRMSKESIV